MNLWQAIGSAVVLKVESPDITHKTDIGGVLLDLNDEVAIRDGFLKLTRTVAEKLPRARLDGLIVQPMVRGELELVMGVKRDPIFGMVVMAGLGGVLVEVLKDVVFRIPPFDTEEAERMLRELRMSALLDGVRGQRGIGRRGVAKMLARLSCWAAAAESSLAELDLNPVLVGSTGPIAVDCVMVLKRK